MPNPAADGALPVGRSRVVETERLAGVVLEVDASREPQALEVLHAGLELLPEGHRLGYGVELSVVGLGAWVGDRRLRLRIWPVVQAPDGRIDEDDPEDPLRRQLLVDLDPVADREALDGLVRLGRVIVASPDGGPIPLVVDVDRDEAQAAIEALDA